MKHLLATILLITSLVSYSQINESYNTIQKVFGDENIAATKTNETHYEIKKLKDSETIKFSYNNQIVNYIELESKKPISNNRFHKLAKKLTPNFKLTSSGNAQNFNFYFDSKNKLLNIKVYNSTKKEVLNKIIFIADWNLILKLVPEINSWK
ncbi:MAG: hypothetical protein ACPG6B_03315 [Oceanihabitans sp.]